jgi:hypothetical protein
VISGFNTDVEFDGVVYHVQTEDKGLSARKIISLVYDGGTILASKRTPYDDLANGDFDEKVLAERVQKQHSLICAAVMAGRIAELKNMSAVASTAKDAIARTAASPALVSTVEVETAVVPATEVETASVSIEIYEGGIAVPYVPPEIAAELGAVEPVYGPDPAGHSGNPLPVEPILEAVSVVEDDEFLPDEAVEVVSELSGRERPVNFKLVVELLGDTKFKGGDRRTVHIMVCRGTDRKVVADAQIMIKVLGSSFRPVIFHAKSDTNGLAAVHMQLPHFHAGRAALLVRALDHGEEIELRRSVAPG